MARSLCHSLNVGSTGILRGYGESKSQQGFSSATELIASRTRPVDFDLGAKYIEQSLSLDSDEMKVICECARENKITVALGFSERHHDSLYISQATISDAGEILMNRRKMMPTHMERTIFGNSSGGGLDNVVETPIGRVGQLACWEHIQPLLKYHTVTQRETVHVAAWPPVTPYAGAQELWSMSREGTRSLSQTYAIEAGAFVLHTTAVITEKGIEMMGTGSGALMNSPGGGSSAIFGPDGRQISEDLEHTQEGIIYADLDTREILKSKSFVDIVGRKFSEYSFLVDKVC